MWNRIVCLVLGWAFSHALLAEPKLKALIVDGQNNHAMWPKITAMMKRYLEETGCFVVDVERTRFTWQGARYLDEFPLKNGKTTSAVPQPIPDADFSPDFSQYDVVINNNGWRASPWPKPTQKAFEDYIRNGGGLVIVHAANNCWPDWKAYNQMIGLGGWGGRTEKHGPYVYFNEQGKLIRDNSPGRGGAHGPQHEFQIAIRDFAHPITRGLPKQWLHAKDELYDRLRGPRKQHANPCHNLRRQRAKRLGTARTDDDDHRLWKRPNLSHANGTRRLLRRMRWVHRCLPTRRRMGGHRKSYAKKPPKRLPNGNSIQPPKIQLARVFLPMTTCMPSSKPARKNSLPRLLPS